MQGEQKNLELLINYSTILRNAHSNKNAHLKGKN